MTRILLALILTSTALSAGAANWPWETYTSVEPPQYCKGFVVGGLASKQVSGMSRTDLWLAWNYIIRSGTLDFDATASEFQTGREQFQNTPDAVAATSVLQQADGSCGLGRSGHQITGW